MKRCSPLKDRTEAKQSKHAGLEYTNRKSKLHAEVKLKAGCHNCLFKCHDKITQNDSTTLLNNYYKLDDYGAKKQYITSLIEIRDPEKRKSYKNLNILSILHDLKL